MATSPSLSPRQLRALASLGRLPELSGFYLAGGSAVAAHLGHRRSVDLDLFSRDPKANLDRLGYTLVGTLGSAQVVAQTDTALTVRQSDLAIDIVRYPYPPLDEPAPGPEGFPMAGLRDLAAMKLSAIAKRGIKRDFWDLHQIVTASSVTLRRALEAYVAKFGVQEADLYHVIRSLTYFEDADKERASPSGLSNAHWQAIKDYFLLEAPPLVRDD